MPKKKQKMGLLDWITSILMIAGSLNWGLVSWFKFDLVETLANYLPILSVEVDFIVKSLVAISGGYWVWRIWTLR